MIECAPALIGIFSISPIPSFPISCPSTVIRALTPAPTNLSGLTKNKADSPGLFWNESCDKFFVPVPAQAEISKKKIEKKIL